jgi:hypothetical protein
LSDFQVLAPNPGGRKARRCETLPDPLGSGEVYPPQEDLSASKGFIPARPDQAIVSIVILELLYLRNLNVASRA